MGNKPSGETHIGELKEDPGAAPKKGAAAPESKLKPPSTGKHSEKSTKEWHKLQDAVIGSSVLNDAAEDGEEARYFQPSAAEMARTDSEIIKEVQDQADAKFFKAVGAHGVAFRSRCRSCITHALGALQ